MEAAVTTKRAGHGRPRPNLALLKARLQKGLSRDDLGALAGISEKQVGLIERGKATHSRASTLAGLANALDADPAEMFPQWFTR